MPRGLHAMFCRPFLDVAIVVIVVVTHNDGRHGGKGFNLHLSVSLSVFPHDISKTDAARIAKLDTEMFHDESWKLIYFGVKRSKIKFVSHKNIAGVGLCTLHSCECWLLVVIILLFLFM